MIINHSKDCIKIIKFLESVGRKQNSFSDAFPYIHHFREKGGDASLKGFNAHCENHEIEGGTNLNVYLRLQYIKVEVNKFMSKNPENTGISSIKFQGFAKSAVDEIPF